MLRPPGGQGLEELVGLVDRDKADLGIQPHRERPAHSGRHLQEAMPRPGRSVILVLHGAQTITQNVPSS